MRVSQRSIYLYPILYMLYVCSYRFPSMFPQGHIVRNAQNELDGIIQQGLMSITKLASNEQTDKSKDGEDDDMILLKGINLLTFNNLQSQSINNGDFVPACSQR